MIDDLYNDYIDTAINEHLNKNRNSLEHEAISKIPSTNCYYNSVNIAVGRQASGKTLSIMKEIIKIASMSDNTHLLVYINKTGEPTDATFESLKPMIEIPIKYVSQDNAEEYVKELLEYKQLYNTVMEQNLQDKIIDEQVDALFSKLYIDNFNRTSLHTLIFLDDAAKSPLLVKDKSYFNSLMTQCRHIKCSFFLAVQYWKALNTNIKSNVATIFIFSGFSRQQLNIILYQTNVGMPMDELWSKYIKLKTHDKLVVDSIAGNISIQ